MPDYVTLDHVKTAIDRLKGHYARGEGEEAERLKSAIRWVLDREPEADGTFEGIVNGDPTNPLPQKTCFSESED